jgi:uncharacterized membrane protein
MKANNLMSKELFTNSLQIVTIWNKKMGKLLNRSAVHAFSSHSSPGNRSPIRLWKYFSEWILYGAEIRSYLDWFWIGFAHLYSVVLLGFRQMRGKIKKILADLSENTFRFSFRNTIEISLRFSIRIRANFQLPPKKSISPVCLCL